MSRQRQDVIDAAACRSRCAACPEQNASSGSCAIGDAARFLDRGDARRAVVERAGEHDPDHPRSVDARGRNGTADRSPGGRRSRTRCARRAPRRLRRSGDGRAARRRCGRTGAARHRSDAPRAAARRGSGSPAACSCRARCAARPARRAQVARQIGDDAADRFNATGRSADDDDVVFGHNISWHPSACTKEFLHNSFQAEPRMEDAHEPADALFRATPLVLPRKTDQVAQVPLLDTVGVGPG